MFFEPPYFNNSLRNSQFKKGKGLFLKKRPAMLRNNEIAFSYFFMLPKYVHSLELFMLLQASAAFWHLCHMPYNCMTLQLALENDFLTKNENVILCLSDVLCVLTFYA